MSRIFRLKRSISLKRRSWACCIRQSSICRRARTASRAWDQYCDVLQWARQMQRHGCVDDKALDRAIDAPWVLLLTQWRERTTRSRSHCRPRLYRSCAGMNRSAESVVSRCGTVARKVGTRRELRDLLPARRFPRFGRWSSA